MSEKLSVIRCPSCGAACQFGHGRKTGQCSFCGAQITAPATGQACGGSVDNLLILAQSAADARQFDKALGYYEQIIANGGAGHEVWFAIADIYKNTPGKFGAEIPAIANAISHALETMTPQDRQSYVDTIVDYTFNVAADTWGNWNAYLNETDIGMIPIENARPIAEHYAETCKAVIKCAGIGYSVRPDLTVFVELGLRTCQKVLDDLAPFRYIISNVVFDQFEAKLVQLQAEAERRKSDIDAANRDMAAYLKNGGNAKKHPGFLRRLFGNV